jgi:NTP pyrophosphatase (non-canonical NTP hydrolase)
LQRASSRSYNSNMKQTTLKEAQRFVKLFAEKNNWKDVPNIDKFDHLHEELIEMSSHLRYKNEQERIAYIHEHKDVFVDGIGDLFFGLCRLANQLDVDINEAFDSTKTLIVKKYRQRKSESK